MDDFLFVSYPSQDCLIKPPEADPSKPSSTTTPPPTEPPGPVLICDFEDDLCDWTQTTDDPANAFKWQRKSAKQLANQNIPGPNLDVDEGKNGMFVIASDGMATNETIPNAVTLLRSPFFLWAQHPYECFSFNYYIGAEGVYQHLVIFFASKHGETEQIVWSLEDTNVGEWHVGRVYIGPDDVVPDEEYRVRYIQFIIHENIFTNFTS